MTILRHDYRPLGVACPVRVRPGPRSCCTEVAEVQGLAPGLLASEHHGVGRPPERSNAQNLWIGSGGVPSRVIDSKVTE
ncbi:MAG: hypothetical protein JWQ95_440 [Sphaerisporangium sp.]|nr:hypothetical protein [Sphaerisporangium sp.]